MFFVKTRPQSTTDWAQIKPFSKFYDADEFALTINTDISDWIIVNDYDAVKLADTRILRKYWSECLRAIKCRKAGNFCMAKLIESANFDLRIELEINCEFTNNLPKKEIV